MSFNPALWREFIDANSSSSVGDLLLIGWQKQRMFAGTHCLIPDELHWILHIEEINTLSIFEILLASLFNFVCIKNVFHFLEHTVSFIEGLLWFRLRFVIFISSLLPIPSRLLYRSSKLDKVNNYNNIIIEEEWNR